MLNYRIKCKNTDFVVNEIPLLPKLFSKNSSQYTYLWVRKSGLTSFEALGKISQFFRISTEGVNAEGLKDEDAVTTQIFSVRKIIDKALILQFNTKCKKEKLNLKIDKIIGYGKNKVTERQLYGNLFNITIRNLDSKIAEKTKQYCLSNRFITFINYYDNQRFGLNGGPYNNHIIGEAIIKGNWEKVLREIDSKNIKSSKTENAKTKNNKNAKDYLLDMDKKSIKFYLSAYNSFIWNSKVSSLIKEHNRESKKYFFENLGELNIPSKQNFISSNICSVQGYNLSENKDVTRYLFTRTVLTSVTIFPEDIEQDEFKENKKKINVLFFLPTGSYATMLIKQMYAKILDNNAQKNCSANSSLIPLL